MTKIYSIEIVKEDRGIVQVEAETNAEAEEKARAMVAEGNVTWAMKDNVTTQITGAREKKD